MKAEHQKLDALSLPFLAYDGICKNLRFVVHPEVKLELMGIPGTSGRFGWFYGCEFETRVPDAFDYRRNWIGGEKTRDEHLQDFLKSIDNQRFIRLNKSLGGFQGKNKPFHLGQALDAFHLWMAEELDVDFFLTMDRKLLRSIKYTRAMSPVNCINPSELLWETVKRKGFFGGASFLVGGYKFAKERFS